MFNDISKKIVDIQKELNEVTKNRVINNKPINYKVALMVETTEFIDSLNWKWWKDSEDDILNAKIELVDMLHFLISVSLEEIGYENTIFLLSLYFKNMRQRDKIELDVSKRNENLFLSYEYFTKKLMYNNIPKTWKEFENLSNFIFHKDNYQEIYKIYMIKNALNNVRQLHKDNYIKYWNGVNEDNRFVLDKFIRVDLSKITFKELIDMIDTYYLETVSKFNKTKKDLEEVVNNVLK